jgi:hypothetical protein
MPPELFHQPNACAGIKESLRDLYLSDPRPWLVGFSGGSPREMRPANHDRRSTAPAISRGKDSTLVPALAIPPAQRTKEIYVVCSDTRVVAGADRPIHNACGPTMCATAQTQ